MFKALTTHPSWRDFLFESLRGENAVVEDNVSLVAIANDVQFVNGHNVLGVNIAQKGHIPHQILLKQPVAL